MVSPFVRTSDTEEQALLASSADKQSPDWKPSPVDAILIVLLDVVTQYS
jgi:hypothetical protein